MLSLSLQQVTSVTGIPEQTMRHWRSTLPPLKGLNGYHASFSATDALALLVIRHLVKVMGISVASLQVSSGRIFELLRRSTWSQLAGSLLTIDSTDGTVELGASNELRVPEHPAVVVPMASFAREIRNAWTDHDAFDVQMELLPAEHASLGEGASQ